MAFRRSNSRDETPEDSVREKPREIVEKHVPDYEEKNEWLKEHGTRLIFDGSAA